MNSNTQLSTNHEGIFATEKKEIRRKKHKKLKNKIKTIK